MHDRTSSIDTQSRRHCQEGESVLLAREFQKHRYGFESTQEDASFHLRRISTSHLSSALLWHLQYSIAHKSALTLERPRLWYEPCVLRRTCPIANTICQIPIHLLIRCQHGLIAFLILPILTYTSPHLFYPPPQRSRDSVMRPSEASTPSSSPAT